MKQTRPWLLWLRMALVSLNSCVRWYHVLILVSGNKLCHKLCTLYDTVNWTQEARTPLRCVCLIHVWTACICLEPTSYKLQTNLLHMVMLVLMMSLKLWRSLNELDHVKLWDKFVQTLNQLPMYGNAGANDVHQALMKFQWNRTTSNFGPTLYKHWANFVQMLGPLQQQTLVQVILSHGGKFYWWFCHGSPHCLTSSYKVFWMSMHVLHKVLPHLESIKLSQLALKAWTYLWLSVMT